MEYLKRIIKETVKNSLYKTKFDIWFNENGLRDKKGNPLLVYHGSGKNFKSNFDITNTYDGKHSFTPNKNEALIYTHWDNGDDNWRTINNAWEYLMNMGYELNTKLGYPEKYNLLNMIDKHSKEKIDEKWAYNVIRSFYKDEYSNPTLYYCYLRNAERNEYYENEFNVFDDEDIWLIKKENIIYKPLPTFPDMSLNTYIE
jgi:hypothetical protein